MKSFAVWRFCSRIGLFVPQRARLGAQDLVYQCPMDSDIRSKTEGFCSRCGMKLRAGIPEPVEFPVDLDVSPRAIKPGQKAELKFTVHDPKNGRQIQHFDVVPQKLFHMFVVSRDMQVFVHDHPVFGEDAKFRYNMAFPKPGSLPDTG